jgi:hypothetical protein
VTNRSRAILSIVALFAVFYVLTAPTDAGKAVKSGLGQIEKGAGQLVEFFNSLGS